MPKGTRGLSLSELLSVLAILALLVANNGLPGFARAREARQADAVMTDVIAAISLARQAAVAESRMVTYCRSDDGRHCQGRWEEGSIIFTDRNTDRVINDDDRLLYRLPAISARGRLAFRSFRNRQYLQLTPFGMTNHQNGNFTFCPDNGDPTLARQVIVSVTGRTRMARDTDEDGIVEDSRGEPVDCF